jgi:hypothetical protein
MTKLFEAFGPFRQRLFPTPEEASARDNNRRRKQLIAKKAPYMRELVSNAKIDRYAARYLWLELNPKNDAIHDGIVLLPEDFGLTTEWLEEIYLWDIRNVWSTADSILDSAERWPQVTIPGMSRVQLFEIVLEIWFSLWRQGNGSLVNPYSHRFGLEPGDCIVPYSIFVERVIKMWITCHNDAPETFYFGGRFTDLCRMVDKTPEDFGVSIEQQLKSTPY